MNNHMPTTELQEQQAKELEEFWRKHDEKMMLWEIQREQNRIQEMISREILSRLERHARFYS